MSRPAHERWLERAEYDLETAGAMLTSARYIYVVFMCQQTLEKALKAYVAYQGLEVPPIHNLRRLAEAAKILASLRPEDLERFDFLSQYYLNARYKEDLAELARQVGEDVAKQFLEFTKGTMGWLTHAMMP